MRVVGGELRSRRLEAPRGGGIRPTSDRAREAIFSILGDVTGSAVLDLFCGTGALGIEALSRGAGHAVLVDRYTGTARDNVERLGISDRCRIARSDAVAYLRRSRGRFDLVFCDPPYRLADRLERALDRYLPKHLCPGARVVLESAARQPIELEMPLLRERRYGETMIRIYGSQG